MRTLGTYCLLFGIGSLVLPLFGLQFKLFSPLGSAAPLVGIGLLVVGCILMVLDLRQSES